MQLRPGVFVFELKRSGGLEAKAENIKCLSRLVVVRRCKSRPHCQIPSSCDIVTEIRAADYLKITGCRSCLSSISLCYQG